MAVAAVAVAAVGLAVKIAGDVKTSQAQNAAAEATAKGYDTDAAVADTNAAQTQAQAQQNAIKLGITARRHTGSMSAAYAGSGVTNTGSALDALAEATSQYQSDVHDLQQQGDMRAGAYRTQASFDRQKADYYRTAGGDAAGALGFKVGGDIASAYPTIADSTPASSGKGGKA